MDMDVMGGVHIYSIGRAGSRGNNRSVGVGCKGRICVGRIGLGCVLRRVGDVSGIGRKESTRQVYGVVSGCQEGVETGDIIASSLFVD